MKDKMYNYLLNHNYISFNKTNDKQQELSEERAQAIACKCESLAKEICDKRKCDSFYKSAFENRQKYINQLEKKEEKLIKYLENKIDDIKCVYSYKENEYKKSGKLKIYQDILEKVKSGEYE